jgi:hypothetical protein
MEHQQIDKRKTNFLLRHPEMAKNYICRYYPFSFDELRQYQNDVDWYQISLNQHVEWSYELIDYFVDKLYFRCYTYEYYPGHFCINHGLPWSIELIKRYEHLWDWGFLMTNSKLIRNEEIYSYMKKTYQEYTTDENINKILQKAETFLGNDFDYFENYYELEPVLKDIIIYTESLHQNWEEVEADPNPDWNTICVNVALDWSEQNIEKYRNKIDFRELCFNIAVPWSAEFLKKFMNYFKRDSTTREDEEQNDYEFMGVLCYNRHFPWNMQTITEFENIADFESLSMNFNLDWNIDLLLKYEERWKFSLIYENRAIMPIAFAEMQDKEVMKEMWEMLMKNHKKIE